MNTEISRRSACDRCRGQKLRCVRPQSKPEDGGGGWEGVSHPRNGGEKHLAPCERCMRAGATCINTLTRHRKLMRAEQQQQRPLDISSSSSVSGSSSEKTPSHNVVALNGNVNPYQHGVGGGNPGPAKWNDGRIIERSVHQQRSTSQEHFEERPSKRRSIDPSLSSSLSTQLSLTNNTTPTDHILNSPFFHRQRNSNSTSSSNSLSLNTLDTPTFSSDGNTSKHDMDMTFSMDEIDFRMRMSPDSGSHGETGTLMDILFTPSQSHDTHDTHTTHLAHLRNDAENENGNRDGDRKEDMESKEDCLNRLSELSSTLLKDFSRTNSSTLLEILSPSLSQSCSPSQNAIGRVLQSSQTFLEIVQYLQTLSPPTSSSTTFHPTSNGTSGSGSDPLSDSVSECSYSEYWDENDFIQNPNEHSDPHHQAQNNNILLSNFTTIDPLLSSIDPTDHNPSQKRENPSEPLDMPTTLTILTTYTWLLQTYDTIFSRLYSSLSSDCSDYAIPAILPGLNMGGFNLNNSIHLQFEILLHLSTTLLSRIEETLGINVISAPLPCPPSQSPTAQARGAESGILDTKAASALLDIMFMQKKKDLGYDKGSGGRNGCGKLVRGVIDDIRGVLRSGGI